MKKYLRATLPDIHEAAVAVIQISLVELDGCGGIIASHWVNMTCFFGKSSVFAKDEACSQALHVWSTSAATHHHG